MEKCYSKYLDQLQAVGNETYAAEIKLGMQAMAESIEERIAEGFEDNSNHCVWRDSIHEFSCEMACSAICDELEKFAETDEALRKWLNDSDGRNTQKILDECYYGLFCTK